jgi:hypothetical protein
MVHTSKITKSFSEIKWQFSNITYGELGRCSIDIEIKSRMVAFCKKIICNKQDKIAV